MMVEGINLKDISGSIYEKSYAFKVDEVIQAIADRKYRGVQLQARWMNTESALGFGRRMMDVAYMSAMSAKQEYKQFTIRDWEKLGQRSKKAHIAIEQIISHLVYPQFRTKPPLDANKKPMKAADLIWHPLHHLRYRAELDAGTKPDAQESWQRGHDDAAVLQNASNLLKWIADESERRRMSVVANTQNPGKPEVRAFTEAIVEGWIFLTGKTLNHKSKIMKSALADLWEDVSDIELDWEHALRVCNKQISKSETTLIAERGPHWI